MKAILISDHAKWCALMMNGDKTVEVRKGTALYKAIQKLIDENGYADIYVYCSKNEYLYRTNKGYIASKKPLTVGKGTDYTYAYSDEGKVLFKFRCYKVEEWHNYSWQEITKNACLTDDELRDYSKGVASLYCIHISNLEIFDRPKELSEFHKIVDIRKCDTNYCDDFYSCSKCEKSRLTKAPQSWCYIEVEGEL